MISFAPFPIEGRKVLLVAEGCFSVLGAKTAACFLRYRTDQVVAVLDSTQAGRTADEAVGYGGAVPVVGSVEEALARGVEVAIVGVAPRGGRLDPVSRRAILELARRGVDLISGLHVFLSEDEEIAEAARQGGARIWDVRRVEGLGTVGSGRGCTTGARTVLVVGSDCNVGKMTATYELFRALESSGARASWAATGQTGMILRGRGVAVDRVVSDFVSGAAEELVNYEGREAEVVVVEGQGSLIHPGYAGVTLGLMFGVMPDFLVLAHQAGRQWVRDYPVPIPPLEELLDLHLRVMAPLKAVEFVGVALNTYGLGEEEARQAVEEAARRTGLPATDPVRFGAGELVAPVLRRLRASSQDAS